MVNSPSFEAYISEHCHECFFTYVNSAIENGAVYIPGCRRNSSNTKRLITLDVTSVTAGALYGLGIIFHVILEAKVRIVPTDNTNSPIISSTSLRLQCGMDLGIGLESLVIQNIAVLPTFSLMYSKLLSDTLVPIIRKVDLERTAEKFLKHYFPEALKRPAPVDPSVICAHMGLTVIERQLSSDHSVFGQIVFFDTESSKAGTIYVDPLANYINRGGNVATSIIHECVHWDLHLKAFALRRLCHTGTTEMLCTSDNGDMGALENSVSLMEWQANALASRIQMPLRMFKKQAEATIVRLRQETRKEDLLDIMEQVIDELARIFQVSRLASKIRMVEAGYEEAIGTYVYIDNRYVAPHLVRREHLNHNQTYCISLRDAVRLGVTDAKFKEFTANGLYAYVDAHFVLFSPKYVLTDEAGHPHLTDYASRHMEECCLLFRLSFDAATYDDDQIVLNSLDSRQRIVHTEIVPTYTPVFAAQSLNDKNTYHLSINLSDDDKDRVFAEYQEELAILRKLPNDFLSALGEVMAWRKVNSSHLVDLTGLDKGDVSRYLSGKKEMSPKVLTKILLALHSPPQINEYILRLAPKQFDLRKEEHQRYRFLLQYGTKYNYYDALAYFLR